MPDRTSSRQQQNERKSPLLPFKMATNIDVPTKTLERFMEAAKALNPDTPSKTTVKLGHDHSLWEAASTEDYWLVHSLNIRNWWMTLKISLVMFLFMWPFSMIYLCCKKL